MTGGRSDLRVVILHGAHGGPDTNWFPWLDAELRGHGIEVIRPHCPTPEGQSLQAWFEAFDRAMASRPPRPTILVGHSLGVAFALRLVERSRSGFAGLFLAAGFIGALGLPDYDTINASFFAEPFDWAGIRGRMGPVCRCWAGEDDPYVPLVRTRSVAENLGTCLDVVPSGGHLNGETGFDSFPEMRDAILAGWASVPA